MNNLYYFLNDRNEQIGPLKLEELKSLDLTKSSLVWCEGFEGWVKAKDIQELSIFFEEKISHTFAINTKPPPIPIPINLQISTEKNNPNETTYYSKHNVMVTTKRFIVGSETYSVNNITSVSHKKKSPNWSIPILAILVGLLSINFNPVISIILILFGGIFLYLSKGKYNIILKTSGSETKPFTSKNKNEVTQIVQALNQAIIDRN